MIERAPKNVKIDKFIEQQMKNWELSGRQTPLPPDTAPKLHVAVTISREAGCRGESIAECLASRLGWQKYDREILDYMAKQTNIRRQLFEIIDERHSNWMDDLLQLLVPEAVTERRNYFHTLNRAILTICYHENAVIVGRCANFILPEEYALRVRLVAPLDYRVAAFTKEHNLDPNEARRQLRLIEYNRAKFASIRFGKFPYDPRHYDLTINTASFTDDQICDMITNTLRAKPTATQLKLKA